MSHDSFDPYRKWLGILPEEQPPHHYRLLGVPLYEADPDVIDSAFEQRMSLVRSKQSGRHAALTQTLMNELAAAQVCLLDPDKKAAYDKTLKKKTAVRLDDRAPRSNVAAPVAVMGDQPMQVVAPLPPAGSFSPALPVHPGPIYHAAPVPPARQEPRPPAKAPVAPSAVGPARKASGLSLKLPLILGAVALAVLLVFGITGGLLAAWWWGRDTVAAADGDAGASSDAASNDGAGPAVGGATDGESDGAPPIEDGTGDPADGGEDPVVPPVTPPPGGGTATEQITVRQRKTYAVNDASVLQAVAISPDGAMLALDGPDTPPAVLRTEDAGLVKLFPRTTDAGDVLFSPDGKLLAVAGLENSVGYQLWSFGEADAVRLPGPVPGPLRAAFSPDGSQLATAGVRGTRVAHWEAATGRRQSEFRLGGAASCLAYSPDGRFVAAGRQDGALELYSPGTGAAILTLKSHSQAITDLAFSPDGERLVTCDAANTVVIWSISWEGDEIVASQRQRLAGEGAAGHYAAVAFSPTGRFFVCGGEKPEMYFYDAQRGALAGRTALDSPVQDLSFSRDGKLLAVALPKKAILYEMSLYLQDGSTDLPDTGTPTAQVTPPSSDPAGDPPGSPGDPPLERLPLPTEGKQAAAVARIEELYHPADASRPGEKKRLAGELLTLSKTAGLDPAEKFVLFDTARRLAEEAGDVQLTLDALDGLSAEFEYEAESLEKTVLNLTRQIARVEDLNLLVEAADPLIEQAVAEDRILDAGRLVAALYNLSNSLKVIELRKRFYDQKNELAERYQVWKVAQDAREKLKLDPDDPAANETLGKYLVVHRGEYEAAIDHLAKANDGRLKSAAELDLAARDEAGGPAAQLAAADAWYDVAAADSELKLLYSRAARWYGEAEPQLAGLDRKKASLRLDEIAKMELAEPQTASSGGPAVKSGLSASGRHLADLGRVAGNVVDVDFSVNSELLVSASDDGTAALWNVKSQSNERSINLDSRGLCSVCFSPTGYDYAVAGNSGRVYVYSGSQYLRSLERSPSGNAVSVTFSRDGSQAIYAVNLSGSVIKFVSADSGAEARSVPSSHLVHGQIRLSPDGRALAVILNRGVQVVVLGTRGVVQTFDTDEQPAESICWTREGTLLAASGDGRVQVLNIRTGRGKPLLAKHCANLSSIDLSPDGRVLATGSDDAVKLWDAETGAELTSLDGHAEDINVVRWSPNGKMIASGGGDDVIKLWEVEVKAAGQ